MPSLKIIQGAGEGNWVPLGERATLGRWRGCDLQVKDVESSRTHAEVFSSDGQYYVKYLGSSNGTALNGVRIGEHVLQHGDCIQIGEVKIQYIDEDAPEAETPVLEPPEEPAAAQERPLELPGYEIIERRRRGDLCVTYLATDVAMGRLVALEVISEAYSSDPEPVLERVRSAARLEHPVLAQIHAAGCAEGVVFFSREPATGQSVWRMCGKLPPLEVTEIGAAAAGALAEAHAASFVHGSIRPDRIVRTDGGHVKLLGLGLPLPEVGELSDKPDLQRRPSRIAYMAPEQLSGEGPTEACDIYALGATLYHVVGGRAPYGAVSEKELVPKIRSEGIISLLELRPETPKPLARAIKKMLSRAPEDRQASMAEVREELEAVHQEIETALQRNQLGSSGAVYLTRSSRAVEESKGLPASTIIIVILTLLLLAAVFWLGKLYGIWFIRQGGPAKSSAAHSAPAFYSRTCPAPEEPDSTANKWTPDDSSSAAVTPLPGQV